MVMDTLDYVYMHTCTGTEKHNDHNNYNNDTLTNSYCS